MTNIINPKTNTPFKTMEEAVAHFQAENAALKEAQPKPGQLAISIGKSGTVCLSGMGAYPLALYKGQWLKVIDSIERIKAFIKANDEKLSQGKDDTRFAKATA